MPKHVPLLRLAMLMSFVCAAMPVVQAQDAADVIAELKSKIGDLKTFSADMTMTMGMAGMTIESSGKVTVLDQQMALDMTMDMMGQKMATRSVMDASGIMWSETDFGGMKQVVKMDMNKMMEQSADLTGLPSPGGGLGGNPVEAVEQMLETFDLQLDGKDTIGGVEVYRLSASVKDELKGQMDPTGQMAQMGISLDGVRMAFGVEDGFPREYSMLGPDGNPIMSMTYTNLLLDPEIDASIFSYTPPEGVEVLDMTAMIEQQMESLGDAPGGQFALGAPAPDFTGTSLTGETVSLSDYKGKVVLVDFWATWCGPCIHELPNVVDAYKAYHDKGFEIVAISLDETREDLEAFLKEHPEMAWVQLFDGKGWESDIAMQYNVEAIPFTLLLDQEGIVVRQDLRGEALANALADLLGG